MRKEVIFALLAIMISGCDNGGSGDDDSEAGMRTSFPAEVHPAGPVPFNCVPPGIDTQIVMQKLNSFWQSSVRACGCDQYLLSSGCFGNGFVTPQAYGHIFYDANFLQFLDSRTGSKLPADFFMAHEFGHNIQLRFGISKVGKFQELQADCLGGYYVGFQSESGQVNPKDLFDTFNLACSLGDPAGFPWWATGTHGVCADRVQAVNQGYTGYLNGQLPFQACP